MFTHVEPRMYQLGQFLFKFVGVKYNRDGDRENEIKKRAGARLSFPF